MHGILVLVWISGWMVVLRLLASHFVERLAPTGMLLTAAILTGTGLFFLSFVEGLWSALAVATIFAWGVAFFFPTMVGLVSERLPRTGSLGIVLTAGIGLGMAGGVGVPLMGRIADRYLADALDPAQTVALLERVEAPVSGLSCARAERRPTSGRSAIARARSRDALAATRSGARPLPADGRRPQRRHGQRAPRGRRDTTAERSRWSARPPASCSPRRRAAGRCRSATSRRRRSCSSSCSARCTRSDRRRGGYRAVRLERQAAKE